MEKKMLLCNYKQLKIRNIILNFINIGIIFDILHFKYLLIYPIISNNIIHNFII